MSQCTYVGCECTAVRTLPGSGATLCEIHALEFDQLTDDAVTSEGPAAMKRMLGFWVRAQGGAEVAAAKIAADAEAKFRDAFKRAQSA